MSEPDALNLALGGDGGMDAMGDQWGKRAPQRWTRGNPERTRLFIALEAMTARLRELDARCWIDGFDRLPEVLSACYAGEDFQDTHLYIEALRALNAQTTVVQPEERKPEGPR